MNTFTLNRTIGNGSATWGVLTTDADREWSVLTLEARMPPAGGTYRTRLLPPGEYRLLLTDELVAYRGETILMPWLVVRRVPLFPQAALTPEKKIMSGRIIICCRRADECEGIDIIEVNISCPNVHNGGMAFGTSAKSAAEVTAAVKQVCH